MKYTECGENYGNVDVRYGVRIQSVRVLYIRSARFRKNPSEDGLFNFFG